MENMKMLEINVWKPLRRLQLNKRIKMKAKRFAADCKLLIESLKNGPKNVLPRQR